MESGYRPATGIRRLLCGTQPILSMRALKAALDALDDVDMRGHPRQEPRSDRASSWSSSSRSAATSAPASSRRATMRRGSQVAIAYEQAYPVVQALIERGIIGDFRAPDIMRFGFAPLYLSFRDVADAVDALRDVLASGAWRDPKFAARALVT